MRAGIHWGRPRKLGGDYLGVDVSLAARVGDAAKGGELLVSGPAIAQLDPELQQLRVGRRRRLRGRGAPRDLYVFSVKRAH
jgi:adenylate cyclase